jgi:hypothetical protein
MGRALVAYSSDPADPADPRRQWEGYLSGAKRRFKEIFPRRFRYPTYLEWERGYKWAAHLAWQRELDRATWASRGRHCVLLLLRRLPPFGLVAGHERAVVETGQLGRAEVDPRRACEQRAASARRRPSRRRPAIERSLLRRATPSDRPLSSASSPGNPRS